MIKDITFVVIYLKFTSNHNTSILNSMVLAVVIYLKFTSNHNIEARVIAWLAVVIYLKFTSNHNPDVSIFDRARGCNLFKIYIKPQRCNLFKIYIKPQPHRFYTLNDRLLQPILTIGFLRYNAEV